MKLLITGGAGFVGARLARTLLATATLGGQRIDKVVLADQFPPPADLLADTRVSGLAIDVDTNNGVVTLTGRVPNATAKTAAMEIARGTDNVKNVVDKLTIGK